MRKVLALSAGILLGLAALTLWSSLDKRRSNLAEDAEFTKLYERGRTARIRITYRQGNGSGATTATWIYAQDGDAKKAYILKRSKWVVLAAAAYRCNDVDARAGCEELPGGEPSVGALVDGFATGYTGFAQVLTEDANGLAFTNKSNTKIAGRDAVCATVTVTDGAPLLAKRILDAAGARRAGWEICLDTRTGVVLRMHVVAGDEKTGSGLIATLVDAPIEADFATPGTPAIKRSTPTSTGSPRATPGTAPRDVTVTTAIGCALTLTLIPGDARPSGTTLPCGQPG